MTTPIDQADQGSLLAHRSSSSEPPPAEVSQDRALRRLLRKVSKEMRTYAQHKTGQIRRLVQIGLALSAEKNADRLLERIVDEARSFSRADAGTMFTLDPCRQVLRFAILQNETLQTRLSRASGKEVWLPPIPLEKEGRPNHENVCSHVALTGQSVNIPDVYESETFDFAGPRNYDAMTGYRSRSMLVIPLKNHEDTIIGVLQLLNAKDPETGQIIPFPQEHVDLVASLASQAAVALTNAQLVQDLRNLFYAFIKSIAAAIDEKSPYTGGHVRRVAELTSMFIEEINRIGDGPFAAVRFTDEEAEELRLAAWMHDIGKITTPEHLIDKRTKLETIFDRASLIETRFALIRETMERRHLEQKLQQLTEGRLADDALERTEEAHRREIEALAAEEKVVLGCNNPLEFMKDEHIEELRRIAGKTYAVDGRQQPYLTAEELDYLTVRKGNLTGVERAAIEQHAIVTHKMLKELPFPKNLARVPDYAAHHHEKLDGSGYPDHLKADQLPLQTRILAIADVFEALTSQDRPYKTPLKLSEAMKILAQMRDHNHIDPDLYQLFNQTRLYHKYAQRELAPEQIDTE